MKYDVKPYENDGISGFYEWNKPTFLVEENDERYESIAAEKQEIGMTRDETWDLKTNIAIFMTPRLKLFKSYVCGHPSNLKNQQEWYDILDKIIFAFESSLKDEDDILQKYLDKYDKTDSERESKAFNDWQNDISDGLKLFAEYFNALWW